ncbi:MAG: DUF4249 family protein [Lewinella sp.]|nr:DUF4249 family protein [Lewinella sp.]
MKAAYLYSTFIVLVLLFSACQRDSIADIDTKTAVVKAYLFAGQQVDSFQVTQSYSYAQQDTNLITLDDLDITITKDQEAFPLFPRGEGIYENPDLVIEPGQVYQMDFDWQGETISAETYIPETREAVISTTEIEMEKVDFSGGFGGGPGIQPETVDPVDISWENPEGDYYYVVIRNIEDDPEEIIELPENVDFGDRRRFFFISEPEIMDVYTIDPRRSLTQFGTHQIIVYRVNPEYAALYETSGNSSLSLVQPPSNIVNGLGIFTGVSSDTVYLEVTKAQ